jgi:hypothetical protein
MSVVIVSSWIRVFVPSLRLNPYKLHFCQMYLAAHFFGEEDFRCR